MSDMTVYVVQDATCCGEHGDIVGIYADSEAAEAELAAQQAVAVGDYDRRHFYIEEHEITQ